MHFTRVVLLLAAAPFVAQAQDSVTANPVVRATALRDSGRFAPAAEILRALLESEPDNGDAARLLAQTLYWLKDVKQATAVYEAAIARHPDDTALRLDYARMLVEIRSDARATEILRPLMDSPATRARAMTLAGTIEYWRGDLAGAASSFKAALAADSSTADARRQLNEIRVVSSPWMTIRSGGLTDDQPLDQISAEVEAGWFIDPLTSLSARAQPMFFRVADSASTNLLAAEAGISHYSPSTHVDTRIAGGILHREDGDDWTARGSMRLRLPRGVAIEAMLERAPYLSTLSSVMEPVMPASGRLAVSLDNSREWLGEAAVRLDSFEDDNTVTSGYAWALAPLVRTAGISGSAGYSFAMQDSKETRFALALPLPPVLDAATVLTGRYDPYYTPGNMVSHSALVSVVMRPSARTTLSARGSYAFKATEDAPGFAVVSGPTGPGVAFQVGDRSFNPWNAQVTLNSSVNETVTLSGTVERMNTAFYSATRAGLAVSYRFLPAVSR